MMDNNSPDKKNFIGYRLVPFLIGVGVYVVLTLAYPILTSIAMAGFDSKGFEGDWLASFAAALITFPIWLTIWLIIIVINVAFGILTTWLVGLWVQKKYHNYQTRRFKKKKLYQTAGIASSNYNSKEAEWEAEWEMMKNKEKENSSKENNEKKNSDNQNPEQNTQDSSQK